jgi:hypothetical protein
MLIVKSFPSHRLSLQKAALTQLYERLTKRSFAMQLTNKSKKAFQSTNSTMAPSKDVTNLKINASRLMSSLHESCEFGKAHPYGT